jgi:hypothetical protein
MKLAVIAFIFFFQTNDNVIVPGLSIGKISTYDSEQSLIMRFGQKNVLTKAEYFEYGEPQYQYVTTVFPDTDEEIKLQWSDSLKNKISLVTIFYSGTKSKWMLPEKVKTGMTLEELEKIDNSEIKFEGLSPMETAGSIIFSPSSKLNKYKGKIWMKISSINSSACIEKADIHEDKLFSSRQITCKKNLIVESMIIKF